MSRVYSVGVRPVNFIEPSGPGTPAPSSRSIYALYSDHPARGARSRYWLADGTLVIRMFGASYSIFLPAFSATTPSSMTSVSRDAYSKGHDAGVLPLAASTQFISWFSFGM